MLFFVTVVVVVVVGIRISCVLVSLSRVSRVRGSGNGMEFISLE